jgi:hypothetical protein
MISSCAGGRSAWLEDESFSLPDVKDGDLRPYTAEDDCFLVSRELYLRWVLVVDLDILFAVKKLLLHDADRSVLVS